MYNNNYNNITPKLVKGAVIGVGAIVLLIVAMAFIRPWLNEGGRAKVRPRPSA